MEEAVNRTEIEQALNVELPNVYLEIAKHEDCSFQGNLIYGISESILERNLTYEVQEYAPGYVALGDDGGGRMFLMRGQKDAHLVTLVDMGVITPQKEDVQVSFASLLE